MIVVYMGTPGSGKSYEAVVRIIDNLRRGRQVYAWLDGMNEQTCRELIGVYSNHYGELDNYLHYIQIPPLEVGTERMTFNGKAPAEFLESLPEGAFIVLDEVHKLFSNRDWQTTKNKAFANYCSTHRHLTHDILLITQDLARVDTAVRSLVEWTYRFRKMNFLGKFGEGRYLEYVYGQDDVEGQCLSQKRKKYDHRYFPAYKSYVAQGAKEGLIQRGANILKHPIFYAIPILLAISLYMIFFKSSIATGGLFGKAKPGAAHAAVKVENTPEDAIAAAKGQGIAAKLPGKGEKAADRGELTPGSARASDEKGENVASSAVSVAVSDSGRCADGLVGEDDFKRMAAADEKRLGKAAKFTRDRSGRVTGYVVY